MAKFHLAASFSVAEAAAISAVPEDTLRTWHARNPTQYLGVKSAHRVFYSALEIYFYSIVRDLCAFGVPVRTAMHTAAGLADDAEGSSGPIRDECLLVETAGGKTTTTLAHFGEVKDIPRACLIVPLAKIWADVMAKARETFNREGV